MKVHINVDPSYEDTEITVTCSSINHSIEKMVAILRVLDAKLTGIRGKEIYLLDAANVLYMETVDKKTFLYTETEVYETPLKLYEIEERLEANDFLRVGKSFILNFNQIKSVKADLNGKLLVRMNNGEKVFVSRQYAMAIKRKLGLEK